MPAASREQGAVMVEFALILFPLVLLVVGMLQFGIILNAKIDQTHIASSGARYAAVDQNPGAPGILPDYLKARADTGDMRKYAKLCIDYPLNTNSGTFGQPGDPVRVTMSYDYDLLPLLGPPASITIKGDATMRLETVPDNVAEGCSS